MQLAVLLIFLWSGSTGVTAFRMSLPRTTRLSPHLGLFNPTSTTTAVTCSREATGVPHRAYPAPAGGGGRRGGDVVAVGGHRKVIAGSLLGGKNAGSSGGEEVKVRLGSPLTTHAPHHDFGVERLQQQLHAAGRTQQYRRGQIAK